MIFVLWVFYFSLCSWVFFFFEKSLCSLGLFLLGLGFEFCVTILLIFCVLVLCASDPKSPIGSNPLIRRPEPLV